MIKELSQDQKSAIPGWVAKFTEIGLSCEPADRARAERGVRGHYVAAKLPEPAVIVWSSSPIVTAFAAPVAAEIVDRGGNREEILAGLPALVEGYVRDVALRPEVVRVISEVIQGVELEEKSGGLSDLARRARGVVRDNWSRYNGGAWWCSFTAWATFIRDVVGVEVPISPREDIDTSAGWWWAHKRFVVCTDRPSALNRDAEGRLHGEKGPAVAFRDGWALYFWRGTKVPREWIENPEGLDPRVALSHENIELRRCAAEIIGWGKVLDLLQPKTVDRDENPEIGELLEVDINEERSRFLKVKCGTGRTFVLPVPEDMETARAANAWTYGLEPDELQLEVRT